MDQIYMALAEAVLDPVEERFGKIAATIAGLALVVLPIVGLGVAVWLLA